MCLSVLALRTPFQTDQVSFSPVFAPWYAALINKIRHIIHYSVTVKRQKTGKSHRGKERVNSCNYATKATWSATKMTAIYQIPISLKNNFRLHEEFLIEDMWKAFLTTDPNLLTQTHTHRRQKETPFFKWSKYHSDALLDWFLSWWYPVM